MSLYYTHTAHSGDGNRAGDEAEAFVHTDIKICNPWNDKTFIIFFNG